MFHKEKFFLLKQNSKKKKKNFQREVKIFNAYIIHIEVGMFRITTFILIKISLLFVVRRVSRIQLHYNRIPNLLMQRNSKSVENRLKFLEQKLERKTPR